jgi:hypothetical protein
MLYTSSKGELVYIILFVFPYTELHLTAYVIAALSIKHLIRRFIY